MRTWPAFLILFSGCVPPLQHEVMKQQLDVVVAERDSMKKKLIACEDQNRKLAERLRSRPVRSSVEPAELAEIKKKAFADAEKKYRLRIDRQKNGENSQR